MVHTYETKADAIDDFMPYAQHERVFGLLHVMKQETVLRFGGVVAEGDTESLRRISLLLDYHSGARTETWKAERDLDILIVLLRKGFFPVSAQPWKVLEAFVYYLESRSYISDRHFSITEPPTEAVVLGAYLCRMVSKKYATVEDVQWIGEKIDQITPLLSLLKERGEASRGIISALLGSDAATVSSGVL